MLTVQVQKKQSVQSLELRQSPRISTPKIPVCPTSPSQKCRTHASAEPSETSTIFVRRSHHSITTVAILDPVPVVAEATCRETWEKANFPKKKSKTKMTETEKSQNAKTFCGAFCGMSQVAAAVTPLATHRARLNQEACPE